MTTQIQRTILFIDDDPFMVDVYSIKIHERGHIVLPMKRAEDALAKLRGGLKPDVIVVDLILPGMDGFELLEAINKNKDMIDVPKMVLSNLSKTGDIDRAKSLGAKKYLVKASTSLDQVIIEIKSLCR